MTEAPSWFVYSGYQYEGPFEAEQIRSRIHAGDLSANHYIWSEEMPDWVRVQDVRDFSSSLDTARKAGIECDESPYGDELPGDLPPFSMEEFSEEREELLEEEPLKAIPVETLQSSPSVAAALLRELTEKQEKVKELIPAAVEFYSPGAVLNISPDVVEPQVEKSVSRWQLIAREVEKFLKKDPRRAGAIAASGLLLITILPFAFRSGGSRHEIVALSDVSQEEYKELRTTAAQPVGRNGPSLALAMSRADALAPFFYVATNLPDGARFVVMIEGVEETLLGRTHVSVHAAVTARGGLARTPAFKQSDGRSFPRGDYQIYVSDAPNEPAAVHSLIKDLPAITLPADAPSKLSQPVHLLARKTYFLGGAKDAAYQQNLKAYHKRLQQRAEAELVELKQFTETLEDQLSQTIASFQAAMGRNRPGETSSRWPVFHREWTRLEAQISGIFGNWNPATLEDDYFYFKIYSLLKQAERKVSEIHQAQNSLLESHGSDPDREIRISGDASVAQSSILAIKAKIAHAASQAPSANGMPQRQGL